MSEGKGKRLVYVAEDILKDIMDISRKRGESISRFIEETLKLAARTNRFGYSPEQAAELLEVMQAQRILGGSFVPIEVLSYLTSKALEAGEEQLQAKWYESGRWHGKYLKEKFENPVQAFKNFLKATRWDLSEVEVRQYGNAVKIRCVSTILTTEQTELLAKFIEGAMHSMGYQTEKSDCIKGIISVQFT